MKRLRRCRFRDRGRWISRGGIALLLAVGGLACSTPETVSTLTVERRDFVNTVSAEGLLVAERSVTVAAPSQIEGAARIAWLAPEGTLLKEGDLIARFDPSEMKVQLAKGEADLETRGLEISKAKVEGATRRNEIEADQQLAELELDLAQQGQKTDENLFSRYEIIESEIDQQLAGERRDHATQLASIQQSLSRSEMELLEIERRKAKLEVDTAQGGLASLEVRSPVAGVLSWTRDWQGDPPTVGGQVWKGHEMAQVPDLSSMEAEVYVLEADAAGLVVGCAAEVIVEAHPGISYQGKIRRVDSVAKRRSRGSPVQYFGATIALDTTDPEVMKPGQRVRARLILDRRSDALVIPRQAVFQGPTGPQVYVRERDQFEARSVVIATSSAGLAVVDSGLQEGERVALEAPSALPSTASLAGPESSSKGQAAVSEGRMGSGG
ncbi:MAG: HlyD family efflux transporter periplasmic adaptor subunit [Deltaproteobacteria bacterium]|nr:HlyD family efflux transporter periplasmic adaptor subunit [Deltaproteobacteria bacterium]